MIVDLMRLNPEGERFVGEEPAEVLDMGSATDIRVDSPVRYDLTAELVSDSLIVHGRVEVDASLLCCRCARFFPSLILDPAVNLAVDAQGKESIDLTEDIRESIIVAFPNYPVCQPDCRGLCPQCGVNLNQGSCDCGSQPSDGRPGTLGILKL